MGVYLNSRNPLGIFMDEAASVYFVDKSEMLYDLIPLAAESESLVGMYRGGSGKSNKYLCITRPHRFGKTIMSSMIASFFGRGKDSRAVFRKLKIGAAKDFEAHINKHNVIYINFSEIPPSCTSYQKYIERIEKRLRNDLHKEFPDVEFGREEAIWDVLSIIYEMEEEARFIFVFDEWDYILHKNFITNKDKTAYLEFLSNLLKGKSYVKLAYMTGILPIASYSSGSELNMFYEYTLNTEEKFSTYFGFTEREVDDLFGRYQMRRAEPMNVTREGLHVWYAGYYTKTGECMYSPRSVAAALTNNNLGNYWTGSQLYDEIFQCVRQNTDGIRDDLAQLVTGMMLPANIQLLTDASAKLRTKDEIFSAMAAYGFLSCEHGCVMIPNKELTDKFAEILQKEPSARSAYFSGASQAAVPGGGYGYYV